MNGAYHKHSVSPLEKRLRTEDLILLQGVHILDTLCLVSRALVCYAYEQVAVWNRDPRAVLDVSKHVVLREVDKTVNERIFQHCDVLLVLETHSNCAEAAYDVVEAERLSQLVHLQQAVEKFHRVASGVDICFRAFLEFYKRILVYTSVFHDHDQRPMDVELGIANSRIQAL